MYIFYKLRYWIVLLMSAYLKMVFWTWFSVYSPSMSLCIVFYCIVLYVHLCIELLSWSTLNYVCIMYRQKWIMSEGFWTEESSPNLIFNIDIVFKSISSPCMLLGIIINFCSLSENGFINVRILSSPLTKSRKRLSNDHCSNLIFRI